MTRLRNLSIHEISILRKETNPAVPGALVALHKAQGDFMSRVDAIRKANPAHSRTAAMSKARLEFPAEFAAFQSVPASIVKSEPSPVELAKARARSSFDNLARGIAKSERLGLSTAMSLARRRHPVEFAAAYS